MPDFLDKIKFSVLAVEEKVEPLSLVELLLGKQQEINAIVIASIKYPPIRLPIFAFPGEASPASILSKSLIIFPLF